MEYKIPKSEIVWVTYLNSDSEPAYFITSKQDRNYYFLYEVSDGGLKKIGKAKSPKEFETHIISNI